MKERLTKLAFDLRSNGFPFSATLVDIANTPGVSRKDTLSYLDHIIGTMQWYTRTDLRDEVKQVRDDFAALPVAAGYSTCDVCDHCGDCE